jgi:hypothetical protein
MKTNKFLSSLIAVFVGVILFTPAHALAAAFGVSPPWIENENLKPGSNFVYVINLSANELPDDMIVTPTFEGASEVAQWLTIQNQDSLVMPKGEKMVPMSVNVNIPADAKIGKYEGNLKLSLTPKGNGNSKDIAVLLGSNIAIKLGVIDKDVNDYWVQTISADPIAEGQSVGLKIDVKNLGNTDLTSVPTKASVIDMKTGEKLASGSPDMLNVPVYPQTMGSAEFSFPAPDLKAGDYWLDVESFKDGKSAYKNRLFFTVKSSAINNSVGTAVQVGEGGQNDLNGMNTNLKTSVTVRAPYTNALILVIIGILLVLTGLVAKIYMKMNKKHR